MKTIAIFAHHPLCSVQSVNGIIESLTPHYKFKIFTRHEIEDDFLDDVDCVCFPGGVGDSDRYDNLLVKHRSSIRKFVSSGGHYLGICLGAYWAGHHYFDILDPGTQVMQYIKRPNACTKRPHAKGMQINWRGTEQRMYFYDGCAIVGDNMDVVATYSNNDPMAIIQGKVGLIGCHPESQKNWYSYHSWMPKHWHHNAHHKLLLDFTNSLMSR